MENDILSVNQQNLIDVNEYFKLDFPEQKLKGNRKFEEFKKQKLKELGKDAKLFHCIKDNIYFYVSKTECKILPYYYKKCPLCDNYVCYFCNRRTKRPIGEKGNCCPILSLYYLLFNLRFIYLNEKLQNRCSIVGYSFITLEIFLPYFGPSILIVFIYGQLFLNLSKKQNISIDSLNDEMFDFGNKIYETYGSYFEINKRNFFTFFIFIEGFFGMGMAISFSIYYMYFITLLFVISLFTKFQPLKFYIGIIFHSFDK